MILYHRAAQTGEVRNAIAEADVESNSEAEEEHAKHAQEGHEILEALANCCDNNADVRQETNVFSALRPNEDGVESVNHLGRLN